MNPCPRHPDAQAHWSCGFCKEELCDDCVEAQAYRGEEIHVCKECGGRVRSLSAARTKGAAGSGAAPTETSSSSAPESSGAKTSAPKSVARPQVDPTSPGRQQGPQNVLEKLDVPFLWSGEGVLLLPMLAIASLALAFAPELLAWFPLAGWFYTITEIMIWVWVLGIGIEIVRGAFQGQTELHFQDHLVSGDGLWLQKGAWVALCLLAYGPLFVYLLLTPGDSRSLMLLLALLLWKDFYLSLALPSYAWFGNQASVLPLHCLRDLLRLGPPFLGLLAACFALSLLALALSWLIAHGSGPHLAHALIQFLFFLTFLLKSRWIGRFYHRRLPQLGW